MTDEPKVETHTSWINGLVSAIRTLTAIPVAGEDAGKMTAALPWFPAVGFILAVLVYAVIAVMLWIGGAFTIGVAGVVALIALVLLTRGLHLDGLADWADGFWGSHERERTLAIMKDSNIGTFGAVALICALLGKWACLTVLIGTESLTWLFAALMLSRSVQVMLATTSPYARAEGGTAEPFVQPGEGRSLWISLGTTVVVLVALGLGFATILAVGAAYGAGLLFSMQARRRIGGVTGDLLGAGNELIELLILIIGVCMA